MTTDETVRAATLLLDAATSRTPIPPITETFNALTIQDAYAIQLAQIEALEQAGRSIKGMKVGLTSVSMQQLLGVGQPDFGHLLDDFFFLEHEPVPITRFLQPRVEPEVAFVLKKPLRGPGVTTSEAIAAVDYVVPALEIVDSRITDWRITIIDTIADNASSGGLVLGSTPTPLQEVDLRLGGCVFRRNGKVVGTGAGGAVLGSPVNALVWLANTLGGLGSVLEEQALVLPGAVTAMVPVAQGDTFTATFSGLGSVTARFVHKEESA